MKRESDYRESAGKDVRPAQQVQMGADTPVSYVLQITITDRAAWERAAALNRAHGALANTLVPARGTAQSRILDRLGLERRPRTVLFAYTPEANAYRSLQAQRRGLKLQEANHGICFQCPIGLNLGIRSLEKLLAMNLERLKPEERQDICGLQPLPELEGEALREGLTEGGHLLLLFVVQRGYADTVMDIAREKGARGGTILTGRGFGKYDSRISCGFEISPEKEILLILVRNAEARALVRHVSVKAGLEEPGKGICLILPVLRVCGLPGAEKPAEVPESPDVEKGRESI